MIINLNVKDSLPTIREAFENKTLQMFKPYASPKDSKCTYSGPCAVGACMTEEERTFCDDQLWYGVYSLVNNNVIHTHHKDADVFAVLQNLHDSARLKIENVPEFDRAVKLFGDKLTELEAQYGVAA